MSKTGFIFILLLLLAPTAFAAEKIWQTDFEAAKAQAKAEKKLLLVDFTGSDWCPPCKMLKKEIFDTETFATEAPKQFVLVELDFPNEIEQTEALKEQNAKLAKQYKISGYPTVLVLDADGQTIAKTGYQGKTPPEDYLKELTGFIAINQQIGELKEKLANLQGLDRAKLLDQIVTGYEKLGTHEEETITLGQEIVTLDADNQAGLKVKYGFRTLLAEAGRLRQERKIDEALAAYEKAIALPGISDEQRQDAYFDQGACYFSKRNFSAVVACLEHARDAAPNSSKAEQLEVMLKRFTPIAAAQTEVTEINSELEKAEGIARAKVLDRLIEAQKTLSKAIPDSKLAQKVEVWTKEIIELDADNQAGLKAKYEKKLEAKE